MIHAQMNALSLRGFRRFQEPAQFTFQGPDEKPPTTLVVAGPNGSGKTSFFEAILYALGREDLLHEELRDDVQQRWLDNALSPDVRVELTLYVFSAPGTLLGARTPCSMQIIRSKSGWRVQVGEDAKPIADEQSKIRELLGELPIEWFSSSRHPYLCGPVRPMSEPPDFLRREERRLWQIKQQIVDERTRSAFNDVPGDDKAWLDRMSRAWSALRGDDETRLTVATADRGQARTDIDLYIQRRSKDLAIGDELVCTVDQLSSGELEWLTLVGTLITKYMGQRIGEEGFRGIVLIDEPELHMHPEWQARILPALRDVAPHAQLVLATHADAPWDQVYSFERVLLVSKDDPRAKLETEEIETDTDVEVGG